MSAEPGCRKDKLSMSGNDKLQITIDTLFFDTVFTAHNQVPGVPMSVNKQIVVVNPNKNAVETDIILGGGANSYFRINVDGEPGRKFEDIYIRGGDSIFIFVEVTVNPNNSNNPLIVRDSIIFNTNGNVQDVKLIAWGQDAHYFLSDTLCNVTWSDKLKPYVVHDYVFVPQGCTFTIEEGVKVYFAPYSWLYVEGTIKIKGTVNAPVMMEGDRLQPQYEEVAGQWGGIYMDWPSVNNEISYAYLKNGLVGIYCDSSQANSNPNVIVKNSFVRNMLYDGLAGRGSTMYADNSLFVNCGRYGFLGQEGGDYTLKHCTVATFENTFSRKEPTFVFSNRRRDDFGRIVKTFNISYNFQNCIIYGNLADEFGFDLEPGKFVNRGIDGNLIKSSDTTWKKTNNVTNKDPRFINYKKNDFRLDTLSGAKDIGVLLNPPINTDFADRSRDSKPDAGAFERVE
jgi:hypothetical protein